MSTQKKHTSGPWYICEGLPNHNDEIRGEEGQLVCEFPYGAFGGVDGANARLIAAAPKLLEACEAAFIALGRDGANVLKGPSRAEWEQLSDAIAAAKGAT